MGAIYGSPGTRADLGSFLTEQLCRLSLLGFARPRQTQRNSTAQNVVEVTPHSRLTNPVPPCNVGPCGPMGTHFQEHHQLMFRSVHTSTPQFPPHLLQETLKRRGGESKVLPELGVTQGTCPTHVSVDPPCVHGCLGGGLLEENSLNTNSGNRNHQTITRSSSGGSMIKLAKS